MEVAQSDAEAVFRRLETSESGLSEEEAEPPPGSNTAPTWSPRNSGYRRLKHPGPGLRQSAGDPAAAAGDRLGLERYYQGTNDYRAATVMLSMVVLGVALRFIQEWRADDAAAKLKAMISVTATVVRDGQARELPLGQLVPGDVVRLAAGDMIPADLRIVSCKDLFVIQSSLTGESLPVEKFDAKENARAQAGAGTQEHLLSRHQRGKRLGHGRDRRNRGSEPIWAAWPRPSSARRCRPVSTRA